MPHSTRGRARNDPNRLQDVAIQRANKHGTEYAFSAGPPVIVLDRPQLHIHKAKHKGMFMRD